MYSKYFKAMDCESRGDTVGRNHNYGDIVSGITSYINKEKRPVGKIDEQAFYDLFFIKSRFMSEKTLDSEINSVHRLYPVDQDFFDALHGLVHADSASVPATPN